MRLATLVAAKVGEGDTPGQFGSGAAHNSDGYGAGVLVRPSDRWNSQAVLSEQAQQLHHPGDRSMSFEGEKDQNDLRAAEGERSGDE